MEKTAKKQINSLQAVRAMAAIAIVSCHCALNGLGAWAVSVFFVLSGFVLTYSYSERELDSSIKASIAFSLKKIKKVYPLHILTMMAALAIVVWDLLQEYSVSFLLDTIKNTVLNVLLLQAWVPDANVYFSLNGVTWYLSASLFLYACFPKILSVIKKLSIKGLIGLTASIYIVQIVLGIILANIQDVTASVLFFDRWLTYIFPLTRLGDFVIGCIIARIFLGEYIKLNTVCASVLEVVSLALIVLSEFVYVHQVGVLGRESFRYTVLFLPSTVLFIYLFAANKGIISKTLTCKPIIFLGDISACTFLIHRVMIDYVESAWARLSDADMNNYLKFLVVLTLTIVSSIIYLKIQKNISSKKNRS